MPNLQLLKRKELLGDAPNLISMPVCNVLGDDYEQRGFKRLFEYCRFKDYSYVGILLADKLNEVYEQCSPERVKAYQGNITQGLRKLFWFNVFSYLKSEVFKNVIPEKELNAIYEHHLSPKAVKNYIKRKMGKQQKVIDFFKEQK